MCRIFGSFAAGASGGELARVSARQRHGGPDGHGVLSGAGWSLGCDRLAVTDPAHGRQPYTLPTAPGVLAVLNGQLYNHHALRRHLSARGHHLPDRCDGSVLPALYAEHGPAFVDRLEGMFAVAVLDLRGGPHTPRLVLAVDEAGMKPLYYHHAAGGAVRFASEIPALLAFDAVPVEPRPESLDHVLATRAPFGEETALHGVRVLGPGGTAVHTGLPGRTRRTAPGAPRTSVRESSGSGHQMAPRVPSPSPSVGTRGCPGRGARETLRRAVRRLGQADVPVCAVTSGGLDSGLVTALAARERHRSGLPPLHTFQLSYRGRWPGDESEYAHAVSRRAGTVHHQIAADPAGFAELLPRTVSHLGQPNADPIALSTHVLFRAVRDAGFTVALTGDGADEHFGGYARVVAALTAPEGADWVHPYTEALSAAPRALRERLYTSDYRAFLADRGPASDLIAGRLRAARTDRLSALAQVETGLRMPAYHLRRVDHLSMASGVEVRLPFCQPSMTALARALPARERTGKRALRAAGEGLLPPSVLRRQKQPFTLPLAAMLTRGSPLLDLATDVLSPARLRRDGRLRPEAVTALLRRQASAPVGRSGGAAPLAGEGPQGEGPHTTALTLWALLVHELWREGVREPGVRGAGRAA